MKTVDEEHAAGHRDGSAGLGPIAPRNGPPGSLEHRLHAAYMQSYRDALIARVGIPERRERHRNPKVKRMKRKSAVWKRPRRSSARSRGGHHRLAQQAYSAGSADRAAGKAENTYYTAGPYASSYRLGFHARRRNPRRKASCGKKVARGKTVTTTTRATVIRRENRAPPRRGLVVLYATKPGRRRLKYLGRGKFGERGRPRGFNSRAAARLAAWVLRDSHPAALRGWTLAVGP
jgi:hypothetical protein